MAGRWRAALALLVALGLGTGTGLWPPGGSRTGRCEPAGGVATNCCCGLVRVVEEGERVCDRCTNLGQLTLQPDFGNATSLEMMVQDPSSTPEISATDLDVDALFNESQTTPSTTTAKKKDVLTCLVDILKHVAEFDPTGETPFQLSAITPPVNETKETLLSKLCGTSAENMENLEDLLMTFEPTPSTTPTPPAVLTVQTAPDISVSCVYTSIRLMKALKELAEILETAATKKKNKALGQLINGFSEILEECFKNLHVKYRN